MAEFKRGMMAGRLKHLQEEMTDELTNLQDVFLKLRSEMQILADRWKGSAADEFQMTFFLGWGDMWQEIQALAKVIDGLNQVEQETEITEKKVQDILTMGGWLTEWTD